MSKIQYSVYEFLPEKLIKELSALKNKPLNEIRIRKDCPVKVVINGEVKILNKISLSEAEIERVILRLCKNSIHAYEEQIKRGFITSDNGERVGIAGEFVKENGSILAIKNVTSLCVRIPNEVNGVSNKFYDKFYKNTGGSVLVLSKAGVGKTTFIRDLALNISKNENKNVVVVDERNEIALKGVKNKKSNHCLDVLTYADKHFGFTQAIRTLNPDVIVTDELVCEEDAISLVDTVYGGVDVIATAHAKSIEGFYLRKRFSTLKNSKVFDYYVVISKTGLERNIEIFNSEFKKLCF
ncbi:MAG: Flp pilus assembly complex ATPase component TadA [Clostridia bacterium]|nr:Flp pilus assembly complex ATPase component TadA [Clostridia bacterium]